MKKIFLIVCLFSLSASLQAQIISSSSQKTTVKSNKKINTSWYLKVSLLSMKFSHNMEKVDNEWNYRDWEIGRTLGFKADIGFKKPFRALNTSTDIYWGMDFALGTRGFGLKAINNDVDNGGHYKRSNFQVNPINVGVDYSITKDIVIDGHIGAYISFDYLESWDIKDESDYSIQSIKMRGDLGLMLGIGIWFHGINVELGWQRGFINVCDGNSIAFDESIYGYSMYTNNLIFSVGFKL